MLSEDIVARLLDETKPSFQLTSKSDLNLGFGHILYGVVRAMRPRKVVAIGSKAGFAPLCLALGIADNCGSRLSVIDCEDVRVDDAPGSLDFIDPGYSIGVDEAHFHGVGFWRQPESDGIWGRFGVNEIVRHHTMESSEYAAGLADDFEIDILYVDGDHSYAGVIHDFTAFLPYMRAESLIIAHDVDPRCHTAEGYQVLATAGAELFSAYVRIPMYPGLAIIQPLADDGSCDRFGAPPLIRGHH